MNETWHNPVLLKEVIEILNCHSNGVYVDVTLGGGGYTEEILKASGPLGRVVGFDRDKDAVEESSKRLKEFGDRLEIVQSNFSEIKSALENLNITEVDGIVADLGVSSHQLDEASRGFSFSKDAPLDMRMDDQAEMSAELLVNTYDEKDLADTIYEFGEERLSRRIARIIVERRSEKRIETTKELADIVYRAYPPKLRRGRIHPATRTFQAIRIAVNDELGELNKLMKDAPDLLKVGGKLVVVSYHSLEDRIVKRRFKELDKEGFKRITKKPLRAGEEETEENRRARSAKLRALERV